MDVCVVFNFGVASVCAWFSLCLSLDLVGSDAEREKREREKEDMHSSHLKTAFEAEKVKWGHHSCSGTGAESAGVPFSSVLAFFFFCPVVFLLKKYRPRIPREAFTPSLLS